jgi:hypothetical protein
VPVLAPLAGALGVSPSVPLLAGFFSEGVWSAAAAGAMSGLVLVLTSATWRAASLVQVPWRALAEPLAASGPAKWLDTGLIVGGVAIVLAWGAAAAISALGARTGTRLGAVSGMAVGLLIMAGALGPWVTDGSQMESVALLQLGLASILVLVVVVLGPPVATGDVGDREARGI